MPITGWICASSAGWPCVFYVYGAVGLAWVLVYFFMGANNPASHKTISTEEKYYIEKSLGHEDGQSVSVIHFLRFGFLIIWFCCRRNQHLGGTSSNPLRCGQC